MNTESFDARNDERVPRVSVVMAAYNYGQYIAQAIQSVIDQTYRDWELIIVDDGSTDDTEKVVAPFLVDSRIRYIQQENRGQPQAKNRGIELSRGEFIAFLDADDVWLPVKLEKQLPLFDDHPEVGVTYTGMRIMDESGCVSSQTIRKQFRGEVFKESLYQTIPPFSSSIVRKQVFENIGYFYEAIPCAIDFELWLRAAMHYQFDYVDEPLLLYRTGHANISRNNNKRRRIVDNVIIPHILNECGGRELLTRNEISKAYHALYLIRGEMDLACSRWSSFCWYLRAISRAPWRWQGWRGLIRSTVPNSVAYTIKNHFFRAHADLESTN